MFDEIESTNKIFLYTEKPKKRLNLTPNTFPIYNRAKGETIMLKKMLALMIATAAFAQEKEPEWEGHKYLKFGASIPLQKQWNYLQAIQLGVGQKWIRKEFIIDLSTDYILHPGYHMVLADISAYYAPKELKGFYVGPGIKAGHYIYQVMNPTNFVDKVEFNLGNVYGTHFSIPLSIGYMSRDKFNDKIYNFIQLQITTKKFLTLTSGVGF